MPPKNGAENGGCFKSLPVILYPKIYVTQNIALIFYCEVIAKHLSVILIGFSFHASCTTATYFYVISVKIYV